MQISSLSMRRVLLSQPLETTSEVTLTPSLTRLILVLSATFASHLSAGKATPAAPVPPNFVIIFADDMGYGDVGVYGHPTIRTPHLDRMAAEGQKWTNFYAASSVCTPSRAGLLTGKLPVRSGMCSDKRRVLFPDSAGGLPPQETTIAKALKSQGYATACVGKWHLGHLPQYLPASHGFDYYFGIPYSNDMDRPEGIDHRESCIDPKVEYFHVPLIRNREEIERPAQQQNITERYTQEALDFIERTKDKPFFLYLAHSMPHVPLFASADYAGKSRRGIYGDVIEEIDGSVGRILDKLRESGIAENTLVVFTSDNGPWLIFDELGGSAGLLRGGKGGTFEGGMREPAIFWWPGRIKSQVVMDLGSTLDLFPTILKLAGGRNAPAEPIDGFDLAPVLLGTGRAARESIFYYRGTEVFAVRHGEFKAHFKTQPEYGGEGATTHSTPLLYNLEIEPSERHNLAAKYPEVIRRITLLKEQHVRETPIAPSQLETRIDETVTGYEAKSL